MSTSTQKQNITLDGQPALSVQHGTHGAIYTAKARFLSNVNKDTDLSGFEASLTAITGSIFMEGEIGFNANIECDAELSDSEVEAVSEQLKQALETFIREKEADNKQPVEVDYPIREGEYIYLYHGTTKAYLSSILEQGILPTSKSNMPSNWDVASAPDRVYLSDTYALHYAITAALRDSEGDDNNAVVIKVKVKLSDLMPDEDFLAHSSGSRGKQILTTTEYYRDQLYELYDEEQLQKLGEQSLEQLGTACVKLVEPANIVDYIEIPPNDCVELVLGGCDPNISLIHHKLKGQQYRNQLEQVWKQYHLSRASSNTDH